MRRRSILRIRNRTFGSTPISYAEMARQILALEGVLAGSLSIAIVDDSTIHAINRRHLDHDWPTDVISFPLVNPTIRTSRESVISAEMAASVASRCGLDPKAEFALYLVHGLLHLCGYDDRTETTVTGCDAERMRILNALGVAPPPGSTGPSSGRRHGREVFERVDHWCIRPHNCSDRRLARPGGARFPEPC